MPRVADYPTQDKRANLPAERIGGRYVTKFDPDIALQIVERIAEGETISKICGKGTGFPHPTTFKRWLLNNPDLAKAVDTARMLSAQVLEEEALDAAREIRTAQRDGTQVRGVEVFLQQLRWSMERRDPAKFGSRTPVSIRVPIQISTTLNMGEDQGSTIDGKSIYTIEAKPVRDVEDAIITAHDTEPGNPLIQGVEIARRKQIEPPNTDPSEPGTEERAQGRREDA